MATYGVLPTASDRFGQDSQGYFPGQTVAGLNPYQTGGLNQMMQGAGQMAGYAPGIMDSAMAGVDQYGSWLQGGGPQIDDRFMEWLSPGEINNIKGSFEVDPYVQDATDAFGGAYKRQFERNVLPTLSANAVMSGNMGSNRHALAQGLATSDFSQQLGEQTRQMQSQAWKDAMQGQLQSRGQTLSALGQDRGRATNAAISNAQNQTQAYGLMPSMMSGVGNLTSQMSNLAMLPGQTALGAGNLYRTVAQQQLDAAKDRWDWTRDEPWNRLQDYASIVQNTDYSGKQYPNVPNSSAAMMQGAGTGMNLGNWLGNSLGGGGSGLPSMGGLGAGGSFASPLSSGIF